VNWLDSHSGEILVIGGGLALSVVSSFAGGNSHLIQSAFNLLQTKGLSSQGSLSTRHLSLPSSNAARGLSDSDSKSLERALGSVVIVEATETVDMHSDAGALCEALQAVRNHFAAKVTNLLALEAKLNDAVGSVGQINHSPA
jgi:hypothetical protein